MTRLSDEFRTGLELAALAYERALSPAARAYLYGRGLTDEVIARYRLGQVDGSVAEHVSYSGMISMPYVTKLGGVTSLKFRQLASDKEPKYLTPYPTRIFNPIALDRAEALGYVAICEGELDAIVLDALCGIPAVGVPGVETYKAHPEWKEMLRGFSRVLMFPDPDEAGKRLASQILSDLDTAHVVALPGDVNETYLQIGSDKIREIAGV